MNADQFRFRAEQFSVCVQQDLASVIDRDHPQPRAFLGGQLLPGDDVGVVLQPGDDDFVARADVSGVPSSAPPD